MLWFVVVRLGVVCIVCMVIDSGVVGFACVWVGLVDCGSVLLHCC